MPAKQIIFRDDVRAKLLAGINTLAQAVRVTRERRAKPRECARVLGGGLLNVRLLMISRTA